MLLASEIPGPPWTSKTMIGGNGGTGVDDSLWLVPSFDFLMDNFLPGWATARVDLSVLIIGSGKDWHGERRL